MKEEHFVRLEQMYLSGNINAFFRPESITVAEGSAVIILPVDKKFFHSAGAVHGSVYFKLMDDASFFAVNSLVKDVFVYTVSYHIQLVRPVTKGILRSEGKVKSASRNLFIAASTLYNEEGKEVGFGTGEFMKSKILLMDVPGYRKGPSR